MKRKLYLLHLNGIFLFMLGLLILWMKLSRPHEAAEKRTFSKLSWKTSAKDRSRRTLVPLEITLCNCCIIRSTATN